MLLFTEGNSSVCVRVRCVVCVCACVKNNLDSCLCVDLSVFQEMCGVTGLLSKLMSCGLNMFVLLLILTQACRQRRWEYI